MVQREKRANRWHVIQSNGCVLGEVPFHVIRECLCLGGSPRGPCKGGAVLRVRFLASSMLSSRSALPRARFQKTLPAGPL